MTTIWDTASNVAADIGYAAGVLVVAGLLIAVAILLWLHIQTRIPFFRDLWPAKGIRRPVFTVAPLGDAGTDPALGSAVGGLIRDRITMRTDRFGLNLVSGQAGVAVALSGLPVVYGRSKTAPSYSGLSEVSGQAKTAVALITFLTALLPRRRFEVAGELRPAGEEGVGLSLELSQNGNVETLASLWSASFHLSGASDGNAYQHLAVPGAAWVDIWITTALDGGGLLTADPQSWAFFRSGLDAHRLGDPKRAQALYEHALAADGTNVGAMANLGIIYRRTRQYRDAEEYLIRALRLTEGLQTAPHLPPAENPDWYRIKYQLAALYTNWAVESEPGIKKSQRAARAGEEATALAITTLGVVDRVARAGRGAGAAPRAYLRDTLRPFLEVTVEPCVLTLLASTISPLPPQPADHLGDWPGREDIRASLSANAIDPWQLIAYVELGPHRPAETQFNLACFYTRVGDLTTASRLLLRGVRETEPQERQRLVDVALIDPVLYPLHQKRPGLKAKLYEMLDAAAPFSDCDQLAQHFELQDRTISHFQALGWAVNWNVDAGDIDLTASRDSDVRLIRVPGPQTSGETVDAVFGGVQRFELQHPDIKRVNASVVIPAVTEYPPAELAAARDRGLEVLQYTGHGFQPLAGP